VALRVEGTGRGRGPELLLVEDTFPPSTTSRIRRLVGVPIGPGHGAELHYLARCDHRRGLYVLGPVRLHAADALGLFPRTDFAPCFSRLLVYPEAVDLTRTDLLGEGVLPHVGLEMTPRTGYSEEFVGVRAFQPGDPPRRVHWPSTARRATPMVKEFQEEITTAISFFLDLGRLGLAGVGDQTTAEYAIKACASLARLASDRGHRFQLVTVGTTIDHLPFGAGPRHLLALLDRLAFVRPGGDQPFLATVAPWVQSLPRGGTAVLLLGAATVDPDEADRVLALLAARTILPVFVLVDDRGFIKLFREQEELHQRAAAAPVLAAHLRRRGARVHLLARGRHLEQALLEGLEGPG
jgi:uncharacterized protein (DUF58 family)